MSSFSRSPDYIAFLLRCWRDGSCWRYSLEQVGVGQRHGFANMDEMVDFLRARTPVATGPGDQCPAAADPADSENEAGECAT